MNTSLLFGAGAQVSSFVRYPVRPRPRPGPPERSWLALLQVAPNRIVHAVI